MSSTEVVSLAKRVETVRDLVNRNRDQMQMALPRHVNVERLIRTFFTSLSTVPKLVNCSERSLIGSLFQCAQLGLEPGTLGLIYLIPFGQDVQVIIGYKGLLQLARRSGEISTVQAHEVYAKDKFEYRYGISPILNHTPSEEADRGKITHFYSIVRLKDGAHLFDVMTKEEIDAHRDRYSRAAKNGPWVTAYAEMGKKTVLRRTLKLAPSAIEMAQAIELDERAEQQMPQGLGVGLELQGLPDEAPPSALDALTETLAEKTA